MIDLTPLEVRKKKGDFRRAMRGYDPALVDDFLDLVADRLEELVRENMTLLERVGRQEEQVRDYRDRERALTEALVSAQEMREEVRRQAVREADLAKRTAEQHAEQVRAAAEAEVRQLRSTAQQKASEQLASLREERQREEQVVRELRARREEFMGSYRALLEQELEELNVMARTAGVPHGRAAARRTAVEEAPVASAPTRAAAAAAPGVVPPAVESPAPVAAARVAQPEPEELPIDDVLDPELDVDMTEDDVAAESAYALGAVPGDVIDEDEEPFAPEPFVDDESAAVVEAWESESSAEPEGVSDATDVSGAGAEERLYDGIAADENNDGVPGPIGLGAPEPWNPAPEWSIPDLQLVGGQDDGDALDLDVDDDDDDEMHRLLRNAAAAGYDLEDEPAADELLLDEAVPEGGEPEPPADDGWLPTLLEDDK